MFEAYCKDCESKLKGWENSKPKYGELLYINILTENTRSKEINYKIKILLKGYKRKQIGEMIFTDVRSNWRRKSVED